MCLYVYASRSREEPEDSVRWDALEMEFQAVMKHQIGAGYWIRSSERAAHAFPAGPCSTPLPPFLV